MENVCRNVCCNHAFIYHKNGISLQGDRVLFEDNFAILDPSWGESGESLSASNGKMVLKPGVAKRYQSINQGNIFQDTDSCIKMSLASSEDPSWGGGFIFWANDHDNYYWLAVSGNGWFTVQRRTSGQDSVLVAWAENAAVKKGLGEWNSLRLVTKANQATVFINGTEIIAFKGQPPEGGGFIGVFGDSPTDSQNVWEFSGLKITKP